MRSGHGFVVQHEHTVFFFERMSQSHDRIVLWIFSFFGGGVTGSSSTGNPRLVPSAARKNSTLEIRPGTRMHMSQARPEGSSGWRTMYVSIIKDYCPGTEVVKESGIHRR